jgi:hypothetical protein
MVHGPSSVDEIALMGNWTPEQVEATLRSPTSMIIMTTNPPMAPRVATLECGPLCDSGISCSMTT